jgi:hypothetical protein
MKRTLILKGVKINRINVVFKRFKVSLDIFKLILMLIFKYNILFEEFMLNRLLTIKI